MFFEAKEGVLDLINEYEMQLRTCAEWENEDRGDNTSEVKGRTNLPEQRG